MRAVQVGRHHRAGRRDRRNGYGTRTSLIPAILKAVAYGSLVGSSVPAAAPPSGCLAEFPDRYQDEPKQQFVHVVRVRGVKIMLLLYHHVFIRNKIRGYVLLATMRPLRAARSLWSIPPNACTARARRARSSSSRCAAPDHVAALRKLPNAIAEPTIPRWPATKIR